MIDLKICKKCACGDYVPPIFSAEGGDVVVGPMVLCKMAGCEMLAGEDEPPTNCPYQLEHILIMQNADEDLIRGLSGVKTQRK